MCIVVENLAAHWIFVLTVCIELLCYALQINRIRWGGRWSLWNWNNEAIGQPEYYRDHNAMPFGYSSSFLISLSRFVLRAHLEFLCALGSHRAEDTPSRGNLILWMRKRYPSTAQLLRSNKLSSLVTWMAISHGWKQFLIPPRNLVGPALDLVRIRRGATLSAFTNGPASTCDIFSPVSPSFL